MNSKLVLRKNIKNSTGADNTRKILDALLRDFKRPYHKKDLILNQELKDMSDSSMDRAVKRLQGLRILKKTPKAKLKPTGKERGKEFYLIEGLVTFKRLFEILQEDYLQALLASEYTNRIIEKYSLTRVYKIIREDIKNPDSIQGASKALLNQPAVIRKYRDDANFISNFLSKYYGPDLLEFYKLGIDLKDEIRPNSKEYAEIYGLLVDRANVASPLDLGYREAPSSLLFDDKIEQIKAKIGYKLRPLSSKHIEFLNTFDKLESVRLYRNVIYREIVELFGRLSVIPGLGSKSLFQFMEWDNYLSPFTSYPVQSPEIPLFSRPFQRIYDDVYLLSSDDLKVLADRAYVIYKNFAGFLSDFFRYSAPIDSKALRTELMEFIYLWNVSSTNFDLVWLYLKDVYGECTGSGNYHLLSDGMRFRLTDLKINEPLTDDEGYIKIFSPKPIIFEKRYEARRSMERPFTHLRPCSCFKDLFGWSDMISIDQILLELKSSYENNDADTSQTSRS